MRSLEERYKSLKIVRGIIEKVFEWLRITYTQN